MARVRLKVVLLGALTCTAVVFAAFGGLAAYVAWRTPARAYAQDFDANLARTQPVIWPAVQADPALHKEILDKTGAAFLRGGWPAATSMFYRVVHAQMEAYGGDAPTLACSAAWQNVYRALLPNPHACYLLDAVGTSALPPGLAAAQIDRATRLCDEAAVDGAQRRSLPDPPQTSSDEERRKLWLATLDAPKRLPDDERRALMQTGPVDEAALCRGKIDHGDNLLAQPRDAAARFLRYNYAAEENSADPLDKPSKPPVAGPPPAAFDCAAPGTRFTLSMYGRDGLPITWTSQGRHGWDCALQSSASGLRGAFTDLKGDVGNPIALLWPLAVGKAANCGCEGDNVGIYRVVSNERYWLPFGWVQAYAIEEDVSSWNGQALYTMTKYWSPELGFPIGQHTVVKSGRWPKGMAPDWQVIAMQGR
jgi:hypothetical protein